MKIITGQNDVLGPWFFSLQESGEWYEGAGQLIGLATDSGEIVAAVLYTDYNSANINMHISAVSGKRWLIREYLWYCFHYPFVELNCKRITGIVGSDNLQAQKFDENLGFTLEATLKDAHPNGDLLLYVMRKEDCRWLHLKEKLHGQKQSSTSTGLCSSS